MNNSELPKCRKCGETLSGKVRYDFTTCPKCGKRWRLNAEHTAIYSVTLEVQSVRHGVTSQIK